jgi:hypothetical protein
MIIAPPPPQPEAGELRLGSPRLRRFVMKETLAQITAPKPKAFTAGIVLWDHRTASAAVPHLHGHERGGDHAVDRWFLIRSPCVGACLYGQRA